MKLLRDFPDKVWTRLCCATLHRLVAQPPHSLPRCLPNGSQSEPNLSLPLPNIQSSYFVYVFHSPNMAALASFQTAFDKLRESVSQSDAQKFKSTTLQDVWNAAIEIEKTQRQRQSVRNMKRIEPFLKGLEKYSKTIEVLCNGTPFLPWIWVSGLSFCSRLGS
jgi:hypothetical protein